MQQLLTVKTSQLLKVKEQTLRLWACKGRLKAYKVGGLRFKLRDIEAFVNQNAITQPRPVQEILDTLSSEVYNSCKV